MFAYIEGRVTEKYADAMVVEAGGVGFLVSATPQTISSVSGSGARCRVYTKVVAKKDDVWEIYGFATREEREMFEKLTSVSGVGPKMALGVLSALPVRDLALAIVAGDAKALKAAPGTALTLIALPFALTGAVSLAALNHLPDNSGALAAAGFGLALSALYWSMADRLVRLSLGAALAICLLSLAVLAAECVKMARDARFGNYTEEYQWN